jgi:SAM-dependent methyltransferase
VLDLGCGTGNHAFPLFQRGYEVVGVERADNMLVQAQQKQHRVGGNGKLRFEQGDIRNLHLGREFDAVLMMFAVLGYQLENADVSLVLENARRHLRRGGLLIFDVWYGPAVLHQRPSQRVRVIPTTDGKIIRIASGEIDVLRHVCKVTYQLWRIAAQQVVADTEETHLMRYYFPLELNLFLESTGFQLLRLGAFSEFARDPDETTWNCLVVAQAR